MGRQNERKFRAQDPGDMGGLPPGEQWIPTAATAMKQQPLIAAVHQLPDMHIHVHCPQKVRLKKVNYCDLKSI